MVGGVIIRLTGLEHWLLETRGLGEMEPHPLVAADFDDQASGFQTSLFGFGHIVERMVRFVQSAVYDDARLADQVRQRSLGAVMLHHRYAGLAFSALAKTDVVAI